MYNYILERRALNQLIWVSLPPPPAILTFRMPSLSRCIHPLCEMESSGMGKDTHVSRVPVLCQTLLVDYLIWNRNEKLPYQVREITPQRSISVPFLWFLFLVVHYFLNLRRFHVKVTLPLAYNQIDFSPLMELLNANLTPNQRGVALTSSVVGVGQSGCALVQVCFSKILCLHSKVVDGQHLEISQGKCYFL